MFYHVIELFLLFLTLILSLVDYLTLCFCQLQFHVTSSGQSSLIDHYSIRTYSDQSLFIDSSDTYVPLFLFQIVIPLIELSRIIFKEKFDGICLISTQLKDNTYIKLIVVQHCLIYILQVLYFII